jgi:surface protein
LDISATDAPTITSLSLYQMFRYCTSLTIPDFSAWNVSSVTNVSRMFDRSSFNGNIISWDVSNVTRMDWMFFSNTSFNQNIGGWDVSSVTNMSRMFERSSFNQPIGDWTTTSLTNCFYMFYFNTVFNQNIGNWDVNQVTNFSTFMNSTTLSTANYDALLIAWDAQGAMSYSGTVNFGSSQYTSGGAAEAARTSLIAKWGGIVDGGAA